MSGQSALSKGEMVVGKQGTSCVVYMDFNVGHVCLVRFFSEFVFYGLPAFKSRLLYFEVFVHSHWGHIQGSACRCLRCKPWWVKRLQKTHLTSKRQMLSSAKLRPRCAHFLFDKKHPLFFSPELPSADPRQAFTALHFLYVLYTKAASEAHSGNCTLPHIHSNWAVIG